MYAAAGSAISILHAHPGHTIRSTQGPTSSAAPLPCFAAGTQPAPFPLPAGTVSAHVGRLEVPVVAPGGPEDSSSASGDRVPLRRFVEVRGGGLTHSCTHAAGWAGRGHIP